MEKEAARPRAGAKSATAFRTISEVSDELDVPQHVLRFWETKFPQVRPLKRGGGRRYYRPEDVALLRKIQRLLYSEGYTIKGVQRLLKDQRQAGTEGEDAEALVDSMLRPELGAEELPGEEMPGEDQPGDDSAEAEEESEADPPEEPPPPARPPAIERPLPVAHAPAPVPVWTEAVSTVSPAVLPAAACASAPSIAAGELPVWLRRELTALRTELIDLKSVLRKAIR